MYRRLLTLSVMVFLPTQLLANGEKLRVMTFNIRYANPNDPVIWKDRRGDASNCDAPSLRRDTAANKTRPRTRFLRYL